jgi:hypothetical protein
MAALILLVTHVGRATAADTSAPPTAKPATAPEPSDAPSTPAPSAADTIEPIRFIPHDGVWGSFLPRLGVEYYTGPGFGYSNGYTTFDGMVPVFGTSLNHLVYLDLRGIVSDQSSLWGNNVGLGYRFYHPPLNRIFGAWTSWDLRNTNFATYNQVSAGVETIGRYVDFRQNTYIVLGPQTTPTMQFLLPQAFMQGVNVMFPLVTKFDSALSGTDMEVGGPVPFLNRFGTRAYAGGYVFHGDMVGTLGGGQAKLVTRLSNNFDFSLQLRSDRAFGTTFVFGGALRWGGVRRALREPYADAVYNRMMDPVQRNYNVAVLDPIQVNGTPAIDPRTGQPVQVIHVNNQAVPGGNGSLEHPLNSLANAATLAGNYGIILVERGDGTTRGLDQGIVLGNGQRLLGNSMAYTFLSQQFGTVPLNNVPTGTPVFTNSGGPAIVLASGNEVAGLQVAGSGISGNGIRDFNLNHLQLTGGNIFLSNVSGAGSITNTTVTGAPCSGVVIGTSGSGALIVALTNNSFNSNGANGLSLTSAGTSSLTANISNSFFSGNTSTGITATSANASTLNLNVSASTISNNTAGGVVLLANDQSNASLTMTGNTLTGNGTSTVGDGVRVNAASAGNVAVQMTGNQIQNSGLTGIDLSVGAGTFQGTIASNTVTGSGANGIGLVASGGSTNINVHDNVIRDSGIVGLALNRSSVPGQSESLMPAVTATVANNTVTGSGRQGIYVADIEVFASPTTPFTVNITNNQTANNQGAGIWLNSTSALGNSNLVAHVTGNTFTGDNSGGNDMGAFQANVSAFFAPASLSLRLTGNTASPTQGDAFHLANTGGTFLFQDGGQNSPSTYTQVGTITPGIVP